jgi:hypothetical protein
MKMFFVILSKYSFFYRSFCFYLACQETHTENGRDRCKAVGLPELSSGLRQPPGGPGGANRSLLPKGGQLLHTRYDQIK